MIAPQADTFPLKSTIYLNTQVISTVVSPVYNVFACPQSYICTQPKILETSIYTYPFSPGVCVCVNLPAYTSISSPMSL